MHIYPSQDTTGNSPLDPPFPAVFMEFNTSPPSLMYAPTPYPGDVAKITICDRKGAPLFYSNGYNIFHLDGPLMENGDSLLPIAQEGSYPFGFNNNMSMMGLPRPDHEGDYYLVQLYTEPNWYDPKMLLTLIHGAIASGVGIVEYKSKLLFDGHDRIDFFNVTKHANGRDWWVVFSDINIEEQTRTFYSFYLGADTVYLAQSQTIAGYEPVPQSSWQVYTQQRVFSPNGEYFIALDPIHGIRIHPFNRCTGELGDLLTLPYQPGHWGGGGIATSPNSQYLYVSNTEYVFQYDLTAPDIAATQDTVGVYDGYLAPPAGQPTLFGLSHLAPDGKIYFFAGLGWVHYIAQPNKKGDACSVIQRAFEMPVYAWGSPYYPNYRLGPLDGSPCDTLGLNNEPLADFWWFTDSTLTVEFADNSSYEPAEWHWDFGDGGSTSQDTSPVHTFPAAGTYQVCLTVSNQYAADTVCKQVTVGVSKAHEAAALPQVQVFPNPFRQQLRVSLSDRTGRQPQFALLDVLGRQVASARLRDGDTVLDLPALPPGLYVWQVRWPGGAVQSGKSVRME